MGGAPAVLLMLAQPEQAFEYVSLATAHLGIRRADARDAVRLPVDVITVGLHRPEDVENVSWLCAQGLTTMTGVLPAGSRLFAFGAMSIALGEVHPQ